MQEFCLSVQILEVWLVGLGTPVSRLGAKFFEYIMPGKKFQKRSTGCLSVNGKKTSSLRQKFRRVFKGRENPALEEFG